jgi:hypothetical protein
MRLHPSWWLGGAAAAGLAVALFLACGSLARLGRPDTRTEAERRRRLDADWEHIDRRLQLGRSLAAALTEGRLTLGEAIETWRAEDESSPPHLRLHLEMLPGQTAEERYTWSVLAHVRAYLDGDPRAPAVLARLEQELRSPPAAPDLPAQARAQRPPGPPRPGT